MHHVEILAASTCGHCRHLTDVLTDACLGADAEVHAIDLAQHPDAATRAGWMHSPVVLVDGHVLPSSWGQGRHATREDGGAPTGYAYARILRELKREIRKPE